MASSRLERIGTIYTRITGLLRSGAMKEEDKPIWYNIYKAFPPKYEPKCDRPAPNIEIRKIFYNEDKIRAKFHKEHEKLIGSTNLTSQNITPSQKLIACYKKLQQEGTIAEDQLFDAALDIIQSEREALKAELDLHSSSGSLASSFKAAQEREKSGQTASISVKDIFKD